MPNESSVGSAATAGGVAATAVGAGPVRGSRAGVGGDVFGDSFSSGFWLLSAANEGRDLLRDGEAFVLSPLTPQSRRRWFLLVLVW